VEHDVTFDLLDQIRPRVNFSDCLVGLVPLAWLIVANTLEVEAPLENVESQLEACSALAQENSSYQQEHVRATSRAVIERDI
jgi:hypothetical protein